MENKIKRLKFVCNTLDVIVGITLIILGAIGGLSCLGSGSDESGKVIALTILAIIFIPIFFTFIIYGVVLIIHGFVNSIRIARNKNALTNKTGPIVFVIFNSVFFVFSLFFALIFDDSWQIAKLVGAAILIISNIFKLVFLFKLKEFQKELVN